MADIFKFNPFTGKFDITTDADVKGPSGVTAGNLAVFADASGKVLSDGGAMSASALLLDQTTPQTIANGKPTVQGFQFATSPTVGAFSEGKLYWDSTFHTLAIEVDSDVTIQTGQETVVWCYNATGSPITNGQVVYSVGAANGVESIALADNTDVTKSNVLGVCTTASIASGAYGFVTIRGYVNGLNTNSFTVGDLLYLSSTPGALTNSQPSAGSYDVKVARVMTKDPTTGRVFVNIRALSNLTDLGDVTITTPSLDQVVRYNGVEWVNGSPVTSSASVGIEFFCATPSLIGVGADNSIEVLTLSKTPITTAEQVIGPITVGNATVPMAAWLYDTALGRTTIDAGVWDFETYAAVSSVVGGRVSTVTRQVYSVLKQDGGSTVTVSISGTGTSRTATASGGTPFATTKIDASATNTAASYLSTPDGLFQITARTSDTEVTVTVPDTYTNENTATFYVWKKLFGVTTPTITATGTNYASFPVSTAQSAYTITTAHRLGSITFGTSNTAGVTIAITYNGNTRNSHFSTPLITMHNNLAGLQGGTTNEEYHLTAAQHTIATQAANTTVSGYLSTTDWDTFNDKAPTASPSFTGTITLGVGTMVKSTVPTSDNTCTGPMTNEFVSGYSSTAIGELVYLDSSAKWQKADKGTSVATYGSLLGIALEVKAADEAVKVALSGSIVYCTAFPSLTIGSPVYMDDAGAIVVAQPAVADHVIRVVGYAVHADKLLFQPSNDYRMYQ